MFTFSRLITITGPTASGKSTIGKLLADYFNFEFIEEQWSDNPYLDAFNRREGRFIDAEKWFIEKDFLRYQYAKDLLRKGISGVVLDKPFYENYTYVQIAPMTNPEKVQCNELLDNLSVSVDPPDLLIDIKARASLILCRIAMRGRVVESALTYNWFEQFSVAHEELRYKWPSINTIELSAERDDFITDISKLPRLAEEVIRILT